MDIERIKRRLKTSLFGENIYYFEELDSTNQYAMNLAKDGAPEGTVVITSFQRKGKGRSNRPWFSNKGENLLVSLLLRPELEVDSVQKITLATAAILIESIRHFLKNRNMRIPRLEVKWPNDIMLSGKKIGGILAESKLSNKQVEVLVLGIGLNVNTPSETMPNEIKHIATSLIEVTQKPIIIEDLFSFFLKNFEKNYERYERTNYLDAVDHWKKYCKQFGKFILVHAPDYEERGYFEDVNEDGYLIYRTEGGTLKRLIAGDIERI